MTDVEPTLVNTGFHGVTLDVTGTACTGSVSGDWITPLSAQGLVPLLVALRYVEDGTLTDATLTLEVLLNEDDATVYEVSYYDSSFNPIAPLAATSNQRGVMPFQYRDYSKAELYDVLAIRATAAFSGTGGAGSILHATILGMQLPEFRQAVQRR